MRLFVALHPDAATQAWIAASQRRLRKLLARFERALRWVSPESSHITLAFLGEVQEATPIMQALEACRCPSLDLAVAGLGVFPNLRRPAVLWTSVSDATGNLAGLQSEIAQLLAPWVKPERHRFEPHLTLARIRAGAHEHLGPALAKLAADWDGTPQPWHVESFALLRSQLDSAGAKYSIVQVFGRREKR